MTTIRQFAPGDRVRKGQYLVGTVSTFRPMSGSNAGDRRVYTVRTDDGGAFQACDYLLTQDQS